MFSEWVVKMPSKIDFFKIDILRISFFKIPFLSPHWAIFGPSFAILSSSDSYHFLSGLPVTFITCHLKQFVTICNFSVNFVFFCYYFEDPSLLASFVEILFLRGAVPSDMIANSRSALL